MTAVSVHPVSDGHSLNRHAAATVAVAAVAALVAGVALVSMIAEPLAGIASQTRSSNSGAGAAFTLIAPLSWIVFAVGVWASMHDRAEAATLVATMRSAGLSIVPWIALTTGALLWSGGPQIALLTIATITVPLGALATIATAAQTR